ncbi:MULTISPECIES: hypothetical protein [Piscinibacter]|uniref:hypothetical protein n=1 Tax=Piscinibacter TaxID=1114981 RepID=UPI000FDE9E8F|nr:hypothetical protein [Piscinibacter defluvii]
MLTHRLNRLLVLLTGMRNYKPQQLIAVLQDRRYPPLLRVAALRWLIHWAPLEVTKGACYAQRRRAVRLHYSV